MSTFHFRARSVPIALLYLCIVSFGLVITQVGFYWDDWFYAYFIHFFEPSSWLEVFQEDRPLLAWLFRFITPLIGESPLAWQVFAIFTRWLLCLSVWWTLRGLWPQRTIQTTWITFLFALYPGFGQQHIAITYSNGFLVYALFIVSLGLMIYAFRQPRWFWVYMLLSVVASGLSMFTTEYFFGIELLRPVLLWWLLSENVSGTDAPQQRLRQRLPRLCLYWIPYVALMLAFMVMRMSSATPRGTITIFAKLSANPFKAIVNLLITVLQDFFKVSVAAWGQVLNFFKLADYSWASALVDVLVVIITTTLVIFYLSRLDSAPVEADISPETQRRWAAQLTLLGLYTILLGGIPFWMTSLQITLTFPRDRFTLVMMLGTALLLAGLIEWLAILLKKHEARLSALHLPEASMLKLILIGMLIGLAAGMHFRTGLAYRKEWIVQGNFFWQLVWRAPGLQPGTTVMVTDVPFPYDTDHSLFAALHWTYAPEHASRDLDYFYYNVESHLSRGLDPLVENMPLDIKYRLLHFTGSLDQAILVVYRPPACLKVIDPHFDRNLPAKPPFFREALPFSDPSRIILDASPAAQPPTHLFGPEPGHSWCYYFEKADLARQQGNWQQVVKLGDQALGKKRFGRNTAHELMPFIEGYAHVGQWDKAVQLSLEAHQAWDNMRLMVCSLWADIAQTTLPDVGQQAAVSQIHAELTCP